MRDPGWGSAVEKGGGGSCPRVQPSWELPRITSWLLPLEACCCRGRSSSSDDILGSNCSFCPFSLSWWPPLPSQLEQFVPKSDFICKLKFRGECLAKGRKCFGAGPGWGSPIPGGSRSIPVEPGTRGCRCHGNAVPKLSRMSCKICSGFEDKSLFHRRAPGSCSGGEVGGLRGCFGVKVGGFGSLLSPGTSRHSLSSVPEGGEAKVR